MTYDIEKIKSGREPITFVELLLDSCLKIYGESHTNLLTYSEQLDHANWLLANTPIITTNTDIAPDGTLTADTVEDNDITALEYPYQAASSFDVTKTYTASTYVKKDSTPRLTRFPSLYMSFLGSTTELWSIRFDSSTGEYAGGNSATDSDTGIEDLGDYWRVWVTGASVDQLNTSVRVSIYPALGASDSFAVDTSTVGSCVVWGLQIVEGTEPGSYTKTTTAAAAGACTGVLTAGNECYNTRSTCQDTDNYSKILKSYRFCEDIATIPKGLNAIPCIQKKQPKTTSAIVEPDGGIGVRGSIKVFLKDFAHHDRGVDPYVSTRTYTPEDQGTYFGKLFARNPYWQGRELRVRSGYINDDQQFIIEDYKNRFYVMEGITGPSKSQEYTLTGKDILKLVDNDRVKCPAQNTGTLAADLAAGATSATLATGTGAEYAASGTLSIGSEIMDFTRTVDALTLSNRGKWGTEDDDHETGDLVQECYILSSTNVVDFIYDLLTTYAGIGDQYIPYSQGSPLDEWDEEKSLWLAASTMDGPISKPRGVRSLINSACESNGVYIWWDSVEQLIKLKANMPPGANETINTLNDNAHFIEGSVLVKELPDKRISQSWVYYNKIDYSEGDNPSNYAGINTNINTNQETADLYGSVKIREIFAEFLRSDARAGSLSSRLASRYINTPKQITFDLDVKDDDYEIGTIINVDTKEIPGVTGANSIHQMQIIQMTELKLGESWRYTAISSSFGSRFAFVGPNTLGNYTAESEANQTAYGFISDEFGKMSNDDDGYKVG